MNILVLENDPAELDFLQRSLKAAVNMVTSAGSSEQAWSAFEQGGVQLLIVDQDSTGAGGLQLIRRIRASKSRRPVYILLITSVDPGVENEADDILYRPYSAADLKNRMALAERIITLTEKLASLQEQMESQAAFDSLTGFMNRAGFLRQAVGELERSRRASLALSLVALDIDNFKQINDKFGSKTGDDVLEIVAGAIRDKSRPYDCIGRWTGDEFVIALPGVIGADAEKVAERIISGIRGTRVEVQNEPPLNVKISAGIASLLRISANTEIEPIIQAAREAVARAKEEGGDQVYLVFL